MQATSRSLEQIRRGITRAGSAGLVWWKLRNSPAGANALTVELRQVARTSSLRAALHEVNLAAAIKCLRREGIEPILAKGWALSRLYPHPGIRAYGDHDLCVDARDLDCARAAIAGLKRPGLDVDFHVRFRELDAGYDELLSRSREISIQDDAARVLGAEDHFQLICIHTLYHGAWKPIWLCDIALMLESAGGDLDWPSLLKRDSLRAQWILGAVYLAHDVLKARLPRALEAEIAGRRFPAWFREGLLAQWGRGDHYMTGPTVDERLKESSWMQVLRERWPNPVQATIRMGAGINRWPRFPLQVADVVTRTARVVLKNQKRRQA